MSSETHSEPREHRRPAAGRALPGRRTGGASDEKIDRDDAGRIVARYTMHAGVLNGPATFYDAAGQVNQRCVFVGGHLDGMLESWANGQLSQRAHFRGGQLDGPTLLFDPAGRQAQQMTFRAGKRHGDAIIWNQGQAAGAACASPTTSRKASSKPSTKRKGRWCGPPFAAACSTAKPCISTAPAGSSPGWRTRTARSMGGGSTITTTARCARSRPGRNDLLDGEMLRYDRDGRLRERLQFRAGQPVGEPSAYDEKGRLLARRAAH